MTKINRIYDGCHVTYRRQEPAKDWIWCNALDDMSPVVGDALYTESCSYCYLGQPHTLDAHNAAIVRWNEKMAS
jgi:hypothetical protein